MSKKIDEIIEQIKTAIRFKKMPIPSDYHISIYDMEQLLDYITNLQERNDKAIEYINKYEYQRYCPSPYEKEKYIMREEKEGKELLDILKGEDNE